MISVSGDIAKAGNHVRQSPCKYQHDPSNHPVGLLSWIWTIMVFGWSQSRLVLVKPCRVAGEWQHHTAGSGGRVYKDVLYAQLSLRNKKKIWKTGYVWCQKIVKQCSSQSFYPPIETGFDRRFIPVGFLLIWRLTMKKQKSSTPCKKMKQIKTIAWNHETDVFATRSL